MFESLCRIEQKEPLIDTQYNASEPTFLKTSRCYQLWYMFSPYLSIYTAYIEGLHYLTALKLQSYITTSILYIYIYIYIYLIQLSSSERLRFLIVLHAAPCYALLVFRASLVGVLVQSLL